MPHFDFEKHMNGPVAGMDEAGCGPWAGPLVAAAVILPGPFKHNPSFVYDCNDSKQLTPAQREDLYHKLTTCPDIIYSIAIISVSDLNTDNLKGCLPRAYHLALKGLSLKPESALIDGIRDPSLPIPATLLKKGDSLSLSIAAASILAKVARDRIMDDVHQDYPAYGFNTHKGYGTKAHQDALEKYGITPHHRLLYKPIQKILASTHATS